jgi:hypothetical protein
MGHVGRDIESISKAFEEMILMTFRWPIGSGKRCAWDHMLHHLPYAGLFSTERSGGHERVIGASEALFLLWRHHYIPTRV